SPALRRSFTRHESESMNATKNPDDQPRSQQTLEEFLAGQYAIAIRYARSKIPEQDAHDLVQDCLVVLAAKRDQIENFRAFLFKVLCNKIKQYYERRSRQSSWITALIPFDEMPISTLSTRLSIRVARENDLAVAMQKLPLRQYQAFELRYVEG